MKFNILNNGANFNGYNPAHKLSTFSDTILKWITSDIDNPLYASLKLAKTRNSVKFEIEVSNDSLFNFNAFMKEVNIVPLRFEKRKETNSIAKQVQYRNKEENPEIYQSALENIELEYLILKDEYLILKDSEIIVSEGSENPRPEQICYCSDDDKGWCTCESEWDEYERFNNTVVSMDFPTTKFSIKYDRKKWFSKFN